MKKLKFLALALLFSASVPSLSKEIETKEQADAFLDKYCIALINEIAKAVKRQGDLSAKNEWQEVGEQGAYIAGVAKVYNNLCVDD